MTLKIKDTEFLSGENKLLQIINHAGYLFSQYCQVLESLPEGFKDEKISGNIQVLKQTVAQLNKELIETQSNLSQNATQFIEAVDDADNFLY